MTEKQEQELYIQLEEIQEKKLSPGGRTSIPWAKPGEKTTAALLSNNDLDKMKILKTVTQKLDKKSRINFGKKYGGKKLYIAQLKKP